MSASEKHSTLRLVVAVFVSLLTSGTIALFTRSSLLRATRWGWVVFFFYLTWEIIYSDSGKRYALKFRGLYGGMPAMSYVLVPLCFAALGWLFWLGINKVYALAEPPPDTTTSVKPTPTPTATPMSLDELASAIASKMSKPNPSPPSAAPHTSTPPPRLGTGPEAYKRPYR